MDSLFKWLGPGAVAGGLGAAILCGAGLASADNGADAGPGPRGPQAGASASGAAKTGADQTARTTRSGPSGVASARLASAEAPTSRAEAPLALSGALTAPSSRVAAASVKVRTSDNTPSAAPVSASPAPAAAAVSAAPAAAIPAVRPVAAAAVPASAQATAAATAAAGVVPSSVPIDPAQFAGTYYEQGSVKQFFSIVLVNTKAVYTAKPDGTLGVQNSGNYFFNRGPKSSITGSAVPVNPINTALNVGFGGGTPSTKPPGNYLILERAPDYSWAIVSDPSGLSGYILTRSQTIDSQTYKQLLAKARQLGVKGWITPTRQFA